MTQSVNIIYSTINYTELKLNKNNRNIDEKFVNQLITAIKKINLLIDFPILIDKNNYVIDGQHRLEAAKRLKVRIFYTVSKIANCDDAIITNNNQHKWKNEDYLEFYVKKENNNYILLNKFIKKYKITLSIAMNIIFNRGSNSYSLLRSGNLIYTDNDYIHNIIIEYVLDYQKYFKQSIQSTFIDTVKYLVFSEQYNSQIHDIIIKKYDNLPVERRLIRTNIVSNYITQLENIYNYYNRKHIINFMLKK